MKNMLEKEQVEALTNMNQNILEIKRMIKIWYLLTLSTILFVVVSTIIVFPTLNI